MWPDGHVTLQSCGRSNNKAAINSMLLLKEPLTHITEALLSVTDEIQITQAMVLCSSSFKFKVSSDKKGGAVKEQPDESSADSASAPLPPSQSSPGKCSSPVPPAPALWLPKRTVCLCHPLARLSLQADPTSSSPTSTLIIASASNLALPQNLTLN